MSVAIHRDRPSLGRGIAVALALSLGGAAALSVLTSLLAQGAALRLLVMLLGAAYLLYVLAGSSQRVGRIATAAIWSIVAIALWFTAPPFSLYVLTHVAMLWMVRSLYRYSGVLPVLADLGLNAAALAFAFWAATRTGSPFLALWCYFLVQALYVLIPRRIQASRLLPGSRSASAHDTGQAFTRAHRTAEAALRRLAMPR